MDRVPNVTSVFFVSGDVSSAERPGSARGSSASGSSQRQGQENDAQAAEPASAKSVHDRRHGLAREFLDDEQLFVLQQSDWKKVHPKRLATYLALRAHVIGDADGRKLTQAEAAKKYDIKPGGVSRAVARVRDVAPSEALTFYYEGRSGRPDRRNPATWRSGRRRSNYPNPHGAQASQALSALAAQWPLAALPPPYGPGAPGLPPTAPSGAVFPPPRLQPPPVAPAAPPPPPPLYGHGTPGFWPLLPAGVVLPSQRFEQPSGASFAAAHQNFVYGEPFVPFFLSPLLQQPPVGFVAEEATQAAPYAGHADFDAFGRAAWDADGGGYVEDSPEPDETKP